LSTILSFPAGSDRNNLADQAVRFKNAVYVLHCFQKKSHKGISTPKHEMDIVEGRL
jgi:hypothetical protein